MLNCFLCVYHTLLTIDLAVIMRTLNIDILFGVDVMWDSRLQ